MTLGLFVKQAGLCWCTGLREHKVSRPRLGNTLESVFWQIHAEMEVFNPFCPCRVSTQTYYLRLTQERLKKMRGSKTARGSSLHPFELLTVS